MKIGRRTNRIINSIGLSVMALTVILRLFRYCMKIEIKGVLFFLYLLFLVLWILTLRHRMIQKATRNILISIACSELLWILIRTLKYEFFKSETGMRYGWYFYYLPMLMNAALYFMLAVFMKKSDDYKPDKRIWLFPVISILLFLLVLTNDLHQAVFVIPPGLEGLEVGNYSYGWGYVIIMIYIYLCVAVSYGMILVKCRGGRKSHGKKFVHFLPLVPLAVGTIICVLYVLGYAVWFGFYHLDITVFICFFTVATLEMCIQSGLIMSNNGYRELFHIAGIRAFITDETHAPLIVSDIYEKLSEAEISETDMKKSENSPVMLENGLRLSSAPIQGGFVFWQDDLSDLNHVLREILEKNEYLQDKNAIIRQAYDYKKRERQLMEKNRLYNQILSQTKKEIELYAELIERLAVETELEKQKALALKMAFVGAFIKRHDNLVFLSEMDDFIAPSEFSYCIEESLSNLRLGGIECFLSYDLTEAMSFEKIAGMYEAFYHTLYEVMDRLVSVCVYLFEEEYAGGKEAVMILRISGDAGICLPDGRSENIKMEKEEEEWVITIV